ncbi:hypothetical protein LguiB_007095 [Lonicera macranthoides]
MGPRISFSSDFGDTHQANKRENSYTEAPVSSDFEFSVSKYTMNSADELFSKGKLVPLKENKVTTLRDELLVGDEDEVAFPRVPKNSGWWKEKLGLRRSNQNVAKKGGDQKSGSDGGGLGRIDETKKAVFVHELYYANITGDVPVTKLDAGLIVASGTKPTAIYKGFNLHLRKTERL